MYTVKINSKKYRIRASSTAEAMEWAKKQAEVLGIENPQIGVGK